jgi:hypothetical protein
MSRLVTGLRKHREHGETIWEISKSTAAETLAALAEPGSLVYAPPLTKPAVSVLRPARHSMDDDDEAAPREVAPAPADLKPLRAALGQRGLELEPLGAFFFRVSRATTTVGIAADLRVSRCGPRPFPPGRGTGSRGVAAAAPASPAATVSSRPEGQPVRRSAVPLRARGRSADLSSPPRRREPHPWCTARRSSPQSRSIKE